MSGAAPLRLGLRRALGLRLALVAVNLATAVLLARLLGPEGYGVYVFALSVMMIVALPGQAGVPLVIVRELTFRIVDGDWARVRGAVSRLRALVIGYGLVAGAALAAVALVFADRLTGAELRAHLWAAALLPAAILGAATGAGLRGLDHAGAGQAVETLLRPLALLLLVLAALVAGAAPGPGGVMALHALGAGVALAVGLILQHRVLAPRVKGLRPAGETGALLRQIAPFTLIAGIQLILAKTDIVMLRALDGAEAVGHYQVALQWANLALFAHQAMVMAATPALARAHRAGAQGDVQATLTAAARFVFLGALPVALCLLAFGAPLISLTFGAAFAPAWAALSVLVTGRLVQSSFGAIVPLARILGWERVMTALIAAAAALNVGLNALLIPSHGIAGAALASVLSDFAWKGALVVLAWRRLGLSVLPFGPVRAASVRRVG